MYSERSGLYFSLSLFTSFRQIMLTISDSESNSIKCYPDREQTRQYYIMPFQH